MVGGKPFPAAGNYGHICKCGKLPGTIFSAWKRRPPDPQKRCQGERVSILSPPGPPLSPTKGGVLRHPSPWNPPQAVLTKVRKPPACTSWQSGGHVGGGARAENGWPFRVVSRDTEEQKSALPMLISNRWPEAHSLAGLARGGVIFDSGGSTIFIHVAHLVFFSCIW